MKLTKDEQTLYDFFITFGVAVGTIDYPISLLACWTTDDEDNDTVMYPNKQAVIDAYCHFGIMDKPLLLAIKKIKGWK